MSSLIITIITFISKNFKKLLYAYIVISTVLCCVVYNKYQNVKDDNNRLENNQTALLSDIEHYKTKSGSDAIKITQLEFKKSEFEKLCKEQNDKLKDMGIKLKRLESISTTESRTEIDINTSVKDTIIVYDIIGGTKTDTLKHFEWCDTWNKIEGFITKDSVKCKYEGCDTLTIVAEKIPKKFLFFKWGCKRIDVHVTNQNKSNHLMWNKTVKLIK